MEDNPGDLKEYIDDYVEVEKDEMVRKQSSISEDKVENAVFDIQNQCIKYVSENSLFLCEYLSTQNIHSFLYGLKNFF